MQDIRHRRITSGAPLVEAVTDAVHWTVILHPAVPGTPPHDALAGTSNPPFPGTLGAIDFIRVTPFSLDSVKRVSRAIRWMVLAPRMTPARPAPAATAPPESHRVIAPELPLDRFRVDLPPSLQA